MSVGTANLACKNGDGKRHLRNPSSSTATFASAYRLVAVGLCVAAAVHGRAPAWNGHVPPGRFADFGGLACVLADAREGAGFPQGGTAAAAARLALRRRRPDVPLAPAGAAGRRAIPEAAFTAAAGATVMASLALDGEGVRTRARWTGRRGSIVAPAEYPWSEKRQG